MRLLKNFLYNVGYQVFIIIVPVILSPYLSRVVGPEGIGTYSYTYSIVTLFGLLANLGLAKYGNREIAKCGVDREKRSQIFAELLAIKFSCGILTLGIYLCFVTFFVTDYKMAFYIQTLNLLSFILEISWLFWGMQEFRLTVAVCTVMKVISVFLIFIFVKTEADIHKYIFILASNAFLIHLTTWCFVRKYIDIKCFLNCFINRHWKKVALLFFPVIAKYLYSTMDRIMLGKLVGITEVGYYENVQSISMTFIYVLTAMGDVVLPQMTQFYQAGKKEEEKTLFWGIFHLISFLAVGGMYGFIGVADQFVPWFYGEKFSVCVSLLKLIAPVVLLAGYADLLRNIFLLPRYKDKEYVVALFGGALINFVINFRLIPRYGSTGAVIGTITAEFFVLSIQLWFIRKDIQINRLIKSAGVYCIIGLVILFVCWLIHFININPVILILIDIVIGGGVYSFFAYIYINWHEKDLLKSIKNIKKR